MAKVTGNDLVVQTLKNEGVDTVFYLPGGPMSDVARLCIEMQLKSIGVRHEQAAAMMAHAYSRLAGKPGVCFASSGPGTTNLLTGIANSFLDATPVVALGGSSPMTQNGRGAFQEIDQLSVFKPVCKWAERVTDVRRIPELIGKGMRMAAQGQPGPVYLDLPGDILYAQVELDAVPFPRNLPKQPRPAGDPELIEEAVALLRDAKRPLILTGSGVLWSDASAALRKFIDITGIPFSTTPQGRGVIPEDHPLSFLGARSKAFREADVALIIGTRLNFIVGFGLPPRWASDVKMIQVDIHGEEIGRNRTIDIGIVGDARRVLEQLTEAAARVFSSPMNLPWISGLRRASRQNEEKAAALLNTNAVPVHPFRLCKEVRDFMDRDAILVVDGHEILNYARQSIPTHVPGHRINAGANGCMGVALPYGLGAKIAKPDKQVIALSGDGSFGLNGMEMDTAVRHNIPILVVVSNNGGWAGIGEMAGRDLGFTRYDKIAEVLGCHGEHVETPEEIRPGLERAQAAVRAGKPAVVNVITDPRARSQTVRFSTYQPV
ncbi:MAG TPA: thiamine pyrophosphate-binding protein [Thermodesulfobacteriota bacterium]|nr:thiamine pyrophosphate-binding protein [Thermodesulfobacteriota bacterium]